MMRLRFWVSLAVLCGFALPSKSDDAEPRWLRAVEISPDVADRIDVAVSSAIRSLAENGQSCLDEVGSDWLQWSRVDFAGPHFLSVVQGAGFYCMGAAHPDSVELPMTFDLNTGQPVEWSSLLQALPTTPDGSAVVGSPELQKAFLGALADIPPECLGPLSDPGLRFDLWLDGKRRSVVASPKGLPYANKACNDVALLTADQLEPLAPSDRLLSALANAVAP